MDVPRNCTICSKGPFSSIQSANDHFSSAQHQDAQQNKARYASLSSYTDPYFCQVCNEKTNSPKSFMEHMASPRHKAKLDKSQRFMVPSSPVPSSREYDFDGSKGYCHLCNVDLTSKENASQHLNGAKHKKKKVQVSVNVPSLNIRYDCNVCEMSFLDENSREEHFKTQHQPSVYSMNSNNDIVAALYNAQPQSESSDKLERLKKEFIIDIQTELAPLEDKEGTTSIQFPKDPDKEYTFNISTGYCNVCNVELTSVKNKDQHLTGAKHKKARLAWLARKDKQTEVQAPVHVSTKSTSQQNQSSVTMRSVQEEVEYDFDCDTLTGYCNVCRIPLQSVEHASTHLTSAEHGNAKEDWLRGDMSLTLQKNFNNIEKPLMQQNTYYQQTQIGQSVGGNDQMNQSTVFTKNVYRAESPIFPQAREDHSGNKPEYTFNDSRGYCNICDLELTSKQHANQHLSGAKHQKAKAAANVQIGSSTKVLNQSGSEYTLTGSRGFCHICNLELTSRQHAEQHLSGARHRKALNARGGNMSPVTANVNIVPQQQTQQRLNFQQQEPEKEYTFTGTRGYCNVCKLELTSKRHAESHLNGAKHIKAKQRWLKGITVTGPLSCEICQITCSGPESMEQHLTSKKHIEKEQLFGGSQDCIKATASSDKTNWYFCDVCNCRLNSSEQLEVHSKCAKHLANKEKMRGKGLEVNLNQQANICAMATAQHREEEQQNQRDNMQHPVFGTQMLSNVVSIVPQVMPNFVKQLPKLPVDGQIPNNSTIPVAAERLLPGTTVQTNGQPSDLDPLPSFPTLSIGSSLRISSFQNDFQDNQFDDHRSMFTMVRPEVFTSDIPNIQGDNYISGFKRFENLNLEQTSPKNVWSQDSSMEVPQLFENNKNLTDSFKHKEEPNKNLLFKSMSKSSDGDLSLEHRTRSHDVESISSNSQCSSSVMIESEEVIFPEKTVDKLPNFGDTHFPVSDQSVLKSMSSSVSKKKTSGSDEAKAIKNRPKGRHIISSLNSEPSSLESESYQSSVFDDKGENTDDSFPTENIRPSLTVTTPTKPICHGMNPEKDSPYKFFCKTCKKYMNTRKQYNDHVQGNGHLTKIAEEQAPERLHPSTLKSENKYGEIGFNLTKTKPRSYQIELFIMTLDGDRVCFLPTGTGKTLISCMTISAMLEQNPTRQVVFLVDKVLLVLQQSAYIRREIEDRQYNRFSQSDPNKFETRHPLIAALCGGSQNTQGIPLWKHDVIVATADCYKNLLLTKVLKWTDVCLVVFDEAHHCVKNHPFNKILLGYHKQCTPEKRPRLLGLTASPAGRPSVPETIDMLKQLMDNLGGAGIALVKENTYELKKFQSNAHMEPMYIAMTQKERSLKDELQLYLVKCYIHLCKETDLLQQFDLGLSSRTKNLSEQELQQYAKEVDGSLLNSLEITLNQAHPKGKSSQKIASHNAIKHVQFICITLNVLMESGVSMAIEELQELFTQDPNTNFEFAEKYGLPCKGVIDALHTIMQVENSSLSIVLNNETDASPQLHKLVDIISRKDFIDWKSKEAMVLVLVKQRDTAYKMKRLLQANKYVQELQLKIEAVVGHGNTSGTEVGMTVAQQKTVLENMKKKAYHIVVATSVAEEGIDIPECELVITFNPPSTVTALVQMRGRARKNNSKFVVLCNNSKEKEELEDLMTRERNMMEAASRIVK